MTRLLIIQKKNDFVVSHLNFNAFLEKDEKKTHIVFDCYKGMNFTPLFCLTIKIKSNK